MSIKTRITFILILFIVVVIGLGLSSIYVSRLQAEYFTVSAAYVELRENMSEAKRLFDDQAQSFDYFIFLSQNSEKHNYRAKKTELLRKLDQIADSGLYDQYIDECRDKVWRLNELFDRAINLAEGGDNSSAVRLAEQRIIGKANELKEIFDLRIADLNQKVKESRNTAVSFKQRMTDYLTFSFSFIILIMFIMSWGLYRAIASPLKKFERATFEIGKGNLNYHLDVKAKNEFKKIALSFNKMLKDLKEYQDKVTHMGKMAAVGELSGGVAHEINNPLTGILGHAQRLLLKIPEDDPLYPVIKKMERAAIRCRTIVGGLLDFSRSERYDFKIYDIHDILNETFTLCETEIMLKNIKLNRKFASGPIKVRASLRNIQQVFLNIIYNAVHAMPDGGTIDVITGKVRKNKKEYLYVKFKDTGIGFSSDVASRACEPFFTTKEVGEGTGLGLSISYRIVNNHDGMIELSSPGPGKGATVTVFLPA